MPQAKSPTRRLPISSALDQSTPSSLATASRASSAADAGERVEGGEVFAVGDEPLEDAAGQVVGVFDAGRVDGLGGVAQAPQNPGRVGGIQVLEDILGDGEDGPVVDVENGGPGCQHLALRVGYIVAAGKGEGVDAGVHTGDLIVENEGIGDDGAGHAAGLEHVGHSQESGYFIRDAGTGLVYFVKELGRAVDALLQRGRCPGRRRAAERRRGAPCRPGPRRSRQASRNRESGWRRRSR